MNRYIHWCIIASLVFTTYLSEAADHTKLGVQFRFRGATNNKTAADHSQNAKFAHIREAVFWSEHERTKGVYNFAPKDGEVTKLTNRGFKVLLILFGNNSLYYQNKAGAEAASVIDTDAERTAFANFAAAAVTHFKNNPNVSFEIWNEPNSGAFWGNTSRHNNAVDATDYAKLLHFAVPKMKAANSNATIYVGSISSLWSKSFEWFQYVLNYNHPNRPISLPRGVTGVSIHPYGVVYPENHLELGNYNTIRSKMNAKGLQSMSITTSEIGLSLHWIRSRYTGLSISLRDLQDVHGAMYIRQTLVDLYSKMDYSIWYELFDAYPNEANNINGLKWGLLGPDYTPNPEYYIAKKFNQMLQGYTLARRITIGAAKKYIFEFRKSGKSLFIYYTSDYLGLNGQQNVSVTRSQLGIKASDTFVHKDIDLVNQNISSNATNLTLQFSHLPKYLEVTYASEPAPTVEVAENLALKAIVYGNAVGDSAAESIKEVNDGKLGTIFYTTAKYPQNYNLALQTASVVTDVVIKQATAGIEKFAINYLKDGKWHYSGVQTANSAVIKYTINDVRVAKVLLVVKEGVSRGLDIREIEVLKSAGQPLYNIALGKTIYGNAVGDNTGQNIKSLIDGKLATAFLTTPKYPQVYNVALGQTYNIARAVFRQNTANIKKYQVIYRKNGQMVQSDIKTATGNVIWFPIGQAGIDLVQLRVVEGAADGLNLNEIEVHK